MVLKHQSFSWLRATVINNIACLAHAGIYAYVAIPKPPLTQVHKEKRLEWAKLVLTFDDDELKTIVWSDESRVEMFSGKRQWVHRRPD